MQGGKVNAAGELLPGPTSRVAAFNPNGGTAAAQSGLGELPIVSSGDITAASVYGAGGAATAVSAPNAVYVGAGTVASAAADATNLYGGSRAAANAGVAGRLPGMGDSNQFGNVISSQVGRSLGSAFLNQRPSRAFGRGASHARPPGRDGGRPHHHHRTRPKQPRRPPPLPAPRQYRAS